MFEIREIKIRDLRPNNGEVEGLPRNPRKISKKQLEKLKKSLKDAPEMLRLRELIVVPHDEQFVVIAGNQRLEAAKAVGMETLPCKVLPADTAPAKLREYAIKDNLPFGEDDWEVIASDWDTAELEEWGMEVPDKWKSDTTAEEDDFDPDSVKETVCKKGDIWQLGDHRLMCGDSTDAGDVALLMDGKRADICFTSPPYNAGHLDIKGNERTKKKYQNFDDNKTETEYFDFLRKNVKILLGVCVEVFYNIGVVAGSKTAIIDLLHEFKDNFKDFIYWEKSNPVNAIAKGVISSSVELIICLGENNSRSFKDTHFQNGEYYLGVIKGSVASSNEYAKIHKATFPIYLPENIINNFTSQWSIVFDCFGGTGTTLIAAEQLNRKCYMMELDPHYCDVIIARWEKLTGKKATKIN